MTHELGIQIRDLRLLDPLMTSTYPSAILFREKALVVNLEYVLLYCYFELPFCILPQLRTPYNFPWIEQNLHGMQFKFGIAKVKHQF